MIPRQKLDYESKILRAKNNTKIIPSQKQGYENEYLRAKEKKKQSQNYSKSETRLQKWKSQR